MKTPLRLSAVLAAPIAALACVSAAHALHQSRAAPLIRPMPLYPAKAEVAPGVLPAAIAQRLLAAHNRERVRLGMEPLAWDERLAVEARSYAIELARTGRFEHSLPEARRHAGENLFMGTAGAYSPEAMIGDFIDERSDFRPGIFPDIARDGNWHNVGHYTQIIWRETRAVGCAIARGRADDGEISDFLVCRYWPAGNVMGRRVP